MKEDGKKANQSIDGILLWNVDPLLGNDREISNYTAAVYE
jgi:hypothetical protein